MNLTERMLNPRKFAIRKWLYDMLGDRYPKHDPIVERLGSALTTPKDSEDFGKFAVELYEAGYMKCLNDYRGKLESLNIRVSVIPQPGPQS